MSGTELEGLLDEVPEKGPAQTLAKVRYSHAAMIDAIILNPTITQNALAVMFDRSPAWISIVMSSDAFKEQLAARKEEILDPVLRATLKERFEAVVTRSLEVLQEKLSVPASSVPDNLALRAAELGAKALGIGGNAPPPPMVLPHDHLERLAARLSALRGPGQGSGMVYEVVAPTAEVVQ